MPQYLRGNAIAAGKGAGKTEEYIRPQLRRTSPRNSAQQGVSDTISLTGRYQTKEVPFFDKSAKNGALSAFVAAIADTAYISHNIFAVAVSTINILMYFPSIAPRIAAAL